MKTTIATLTLLAAALIFPTESMANSGKMQVNATSVFISSKTIPANVTATFETTLNSGDSVIHVQSSTDPSGGFIGGNDDCPGGGVRSCATVSATGTSRQVFVIVRAFSSTTAGSGTLLVKHNGVQVQSQPVTFAGTKVSLGSLPASSHVFTTRLMNGASDTVLLALGSDESTAVAVDDDDGVGPASWFHLDVPSSGAIVIGSANGTQSGVTTLVWDQQVDSLDSDADGLGNELEIMLSTSSSVQDLNGDGIWDGKDTDGDGIPDGDEVVGKDGAAYIEYPRFGASPQALDKFIEVDWNVCTDAFCQGFPDFYKFPSAQIPDAAIALQGPLDVPGTQRVFAHFDIGVVNNAPAGDPSLTQWGLWGGANRRSGNLSECEIDSRLPGRDRFHLAIVHPKGGNAGTGVCLRTSWNDGRTLAHELGHNLTLDHGGHPGSASGIYHPMYRSIMNYSYQSNANTPYFSSAKYIGVLFNPRGTGESTWQNGVTSATASVFQDFGYLVSGNSVDWNRNGRIDGPVVKAPPRIAGALSTMRNWGAKEGGMAGNYTTDVARDPALARYLTTSGSRLYVFYRKQSTGAVMYKFTTDVESQCSATVTDDAQIDGSCGTFSAECSVPGVSTTMAPSVTEVTQNGIRKLALVYANASNLLRFKLLTVSGSGCAPVGDWGGELPAAGSAVQSSPTAIFNSVDGRMDIFASVAGALRLWSWIPNTGGWISTDQIQTIVGSGANIASGPLGVGVTWGFFYQNSTRQMLAAVQRTNAPIDIYRRSTATSGTWVAMGNVNINADSKPGIAYVPETNVAPSQEGRFYVGAASNTPNIPCRGPFSGGTHCPEVAMSRGNCDGCSTRQPTVWTKLLHGVVEDAVASGSAFALFYDWSVDTNLRSAVDTGGQIWFQPVADGILSTSIMKDQHDYEIMAKNAACVFGQGACKKCMAQNTNGTCAQWQ
jgi:hypothetical protein